MKKYFTCILSILIVVGIVAGLYFTMTEYRASKQSAAAEKTQASLEAPSKPQSPQQPDPVTKPGPDDSDSGDVTLAILMYHVIGNGPNNLFVPADMFNAQMDYLHQKGYHTVTMNEAAKLLASRHIPAKTVVLTFDDGYDSVYTAAWPIMKKYGFTGTIYVCSSFPGRPNYLTWEEIKSLQTEGMEIGSHTRNHTDLKTAGPAKQRDEILGSKKILEDQLGTPVLSFCYPSGAYNDQTPDIVKEAGYSSAVTVAYGHASPHDNIDLLPRMRVSGGLPLNKFEQMIP